MARQTQREDIFTPIHKGIRSMIYDLGTKLQKTDFTDVAVTNAILTQLKHNLQSANSSCIVCMLHEHGGHEDQSIFPQLAPFDSKAVDAMIQEHVEITRQMVEISKVADDLSQLNHKSQRAGADTFFCSSDAHETITDYNPSEGDVLEQEAACDNVAGEIVEEGSTFVLDNSTNNNNATTTENNTTSSSTSSEGVVGDFPATEEEEEPSSPPSTNTITGSGGGDSSDNDATETEEATGTAETQIHDEYYKDGATTTTTAYTQ